MSCERCPCPGICLGWEGFCAWAAEEPPAPINLRHICERSRMGEMPTVDPRVLRDIALIQSIPRCPYFSRPPGCCTGGRCGLRRGAAVSHLDCIPCLERYGVS